jgi:hypothetical protein
MASLRHLKLRTLSEATVGASFARATWRFFGPRVCSSPDFSTKDAAKWVDVLHPLEPTTSSQKECADFYPDRETVTKGGSLAIFYKRETPNCQESG